MLNREALVCQLLSMRAAIDAALAILGEGETGGPDKSGPPSCKHPPERRVSLPTQGRDHWVCQDCGFEYQDEPEKGGG